MVFSRRPAFLLIHISVTGFETMPSGVVILDVVAALRRDGKLFAGRAQVCGLSRLSIALQAAEGRPLAMLVTGVKRTDAGRMILAGTGFFRDEPTSLPPDESERLADELNSGALYAEIMSDVDLSTLDGGM